jgi:hypothetical protein
MLGIGAIIASGKSDTNGKYFPLGVNFGGYHVRKIGQHINKTITTEALVFDRRTKTFTTFYNTCCGISGVPTFTPSQFDGPPGPLGNFDIQGLDYCSGQTIDLTGSSTFSSSNTGVATVSSAGAVHGVTAGFTDSNGSLNYPQQHTVDTCVNKNAYAPTPTTVQVPKYFFSPSAVQTATPPVCVQEGFTGYFLDVSYYVADATSSRVSQSGMAPGENMGDGSGWHDDFATPKTTRSDGSFDDTPNGSCYGTSGHFCAAAAPQSFRLTNGGTVLSIATNTTRRTCTDGIKLVIQGNPAAQNKTYSFGNTQ